MFADYGFHIWYRLNSRQDPWETKTPLLNYVTSSAYTLQTWNHHLSVLFFDDKLNVSVKYLYIIPWLSSLLQPSKNDLNKFIWESTQESIQHTLFLDEKNY